MTDGYIVKNNGAEHEFGIYFKPDGVKKYRCWCDGVSFATFFTYAKNRKDALEQYANYLGLSAPNSYMHASTKYTA